MDRTPISKATLSRLPEYLKVLENLPPNEFPRISATAIAKMLNLGEVQVRKDLAAVCGLGKPKLGYATSDLIEKIEWHLGYGKPTSAVLIGAGKLGRALLQYSEFEQYGVKISAAFDSNEEAIRLGGKTEVLPMYRLKEYCQSQRIKLGVIAVGKGSAQEVCDKMIESGITAVWNFAPCRLNVPEGILVQNENLAVSLAYLNDQLRKQNLEN